MNKDIFTEYMKHLMEYSRKLSRPKIIKSRLPTNLRPHLILDARKMMHVAKNIQNVPESHCHQAKLVPGLLQDFNEYTIYYV